MTADCPDCTSIYETLGGGGGAQDGQFHSLMLIGEPQGKGELTAPHSVPDHERHASALPLQASVF